MEEILKDLASPGWWFTALVVAIIASVAAGFAKDAASVWLASASSWYRRRRAVAIARHRRRVDALASDAALLAVDTIRAVNLSVWFLFASVIFFALPLWTDATLASARFASWAWPGFSAEAAVAYTRVMILAFGLLSMVTGFSATSEWAVVSSAHQTMMKRVLLDVSPD